MIQSLTMQLDLSADERNPAEAGAERAGGERFGRFVRQYGERAFRAAFAFTGNTEEAKEVVQEAFFRIWRNWERFDSGRSLEGWFHAILRNVFLDDYRRARGRRTCALDREAGSGGDGVSYADLLPSGEEAVLDRLQRVERGGDVRRALEELPEEYRAVLVLSDMEGLGYDEIGRVLDLNVGTVRSRLSRARLAFRKEVLKRIEEEGEDA